MARRIRLTIAYDGTDYCGWQIQPGRPSVEGSLREAIAALTKEEPELIGASRTDSGVHARGNVAVFDTETRIPAEKFALALNQRLPEDIRVLRSEEVPGDWHPRKCAAEKTYEYRVCNAQIEDPIGRRFAHHCHFRLDLPAMRRAAALLCGEHDFTSFANPASQVLQNGGSAVREIYEIEVIAEDGAEEAGRRCRGNLLIRVRGNGFLYNMVRILAGTLLDVGMGRTEAETMPDVLAARDRSAAGPTAPARGLMLKEIRYL